MTAAAPTLRVEKQLLREGFSLVGGVDEVGRGALAGPVTIGITVVDAGVRRPLSGVRDSKLLTPAAREALAPRVRRWAVAHAVGHASAAEIDAVGIMEAMRIAAARALAELSVVPEVLLLDGKHDYLGCPRQADLFAAGVGAEPDVAFPPVRTLVKADLRCAAVAAASVIAKTTRDRLMVELGHLHPAYGWDVNKGYSTPEHVDALRRLGPCDLHRRSWRLPVDLDVDAGSDADNPGSVRDDDGMPMHSATFSGPVGSASR